MAADFTPYPKPKKKRKNGRSRRSLSNWRSQVLTMWRYRCGACGILSLDGNRLSAHHLILRSHCADAYVDDPRNGMALCRRCHQQVHEGKLKIRRDWLPPTVVECLAEQGLTWIDGFPAGPCYTYFAKETS